VTETTSAATSSGMLGTAAETPPIEVTAPIIDSSTVVAPAEPVLVVDTPPADTASTGTEI
jgi:hypothetical protein